MPDSHLKIILDLSAGATREGLSQLARDLQGAGAATDKAVAVNNELALALSKTQEAAERLAAAQRDLAANTDPDKTDELKQEVLEAQVALDKEAESATRLGNELVDLKNSTDETAGSNEKAKFSFTELNSAIAIGRQAVQAVKQVYDATVGSTIKLADSVRDLSRTIGATPEEASKLIAAADDVFISVDTLTGAMEAAIRKGVEPTIQGLGKLSDTYLALPPGIERSKFLMDSFGRSGNDLAALMEKGSKGITALGDAAERTGQVLSKQDLEATLEVKQATDDLGDSVQGLTIAFSRGLIPGLVGAVDNLTYFIQTMGDGITAGGNLIKTLQLLQLQEKAHAGIITYEAAALQAEVIAQGHTNAALQEGNENRFTAIAALQKYTPLVHALTGAYDSQIQIAIAAGRATSEYASGLDLAAVKTGALLDAGLSGVIQQAQNDYRAVIAETTPEIAKLTAQIARYQQAQGQTITVTEDATTSAAEYELANIKAAVAQQKVAEYTGDNRQEYLQLVVAADNAAASVVKLGEGFGFSRDFTLDYTSKLRDANGSLAELTGKQAEAEAQLRKTTTEFLLQQVAMSAGKDVQLQVAHSLGLIDDASYNLALTTQKLIDKNDINRDGIIQLGAESAGLAADMKFLADETVHATEAAAKLPDSTGPATTGLAGMGQAAHDAADAMNGIPGEVRSSIIVDHYETWHAKGAGAAGGADFIVPPGFPNDSFPLRVQSGEHVVVEPVGARASQRGGGDTYIINDRMTGALILEQRRQRVMAQHEALMR